MPTALLVSPHPDDEVLGAGVAALLLRAAGWRVVNLACGLGRRADHARREPELRAACAALDVELALLSPPLALSSGDDLVRAEAALRGELAALLPSLAPAVVVAPSPFDAHHAHELVGRAVRDAVTAAGSGTVWWWQLWGSGGPPTLLAELSDAQRSTLASALAAHVGEIARNRFAILLEARLDAGAVLGVEQVFGFGSPARDARSAQTYCETVLTAGGWIHGEPRALPSGGLDPRPSTRSAAGWLASRAHLLSSETQTSTGG